MVIASYPSRRGTLCVRPARNSLARDASALHPEGLAIVILSGLAWQADLRLKPTRASA